MKPSTSNARSERGSSSSSEADDSLVIKNLIANAKAIKDGNKKLDPHLERMKELEENIKKNYRRSVVHRAINPQSNPYVVVSTPCSKSKRSTIFDDLSSISAGISQEYIEPNEIQPSIHENFKKPNTKSLIPIPRNEKHSNNGILRSKEKSHSPIEIDSSDLEEEIVTTEKNHSKSFRDQEIELVTGAVPKIRPNGTQKSNKKNGNIYHHNESSSISSIASERKRRRSERNVREYSESEISDESLGRHRKNNRYKQKLPNRARNRSPSESESWEEDKKKRKYSKNNYYRHKYSSKDKYSSRDSSWNNKDKKRPYSERYYGPSRRRDDSRISRKSSHHKQRQDKSTHRHYRDLSSSDSDNSVKENKRMSRRDKYRDEMKYSHRNRRNRRDETSSHDEDITFKRPNMINKNATSSNKKLTTSQNMSRTLLQDPISRPQDIGTISKIVAMILQNQNLGQESDHSTRSINVSQSNISKKETHILSQNTKSQKSKEKDWRKFLDTIQRKYHSPSSSLDFRHSNEWSQANCALAKVQISKKLARNPWIDLNPSQQNDTRPDVNGTFKFNSSSKSKKQMSRFQPGKLNQVLNNLSERGKKTGRKRKITKKIMPKRNELNGRARLDEILGYRGPEEVVPTERTIINKTVVKIRDQGTQFSPLEEKASVSKKIADSTQLSPLFGWGQSMNQEGDSQYKKRINNETTSNENVELGTGRRTRSMNREKSKLQSSLNGTEKSIRVGRAFQTLPNEQFDFSENETVPTREEIIDDAMEPEGNNFIEDINEDPKDDAAISFKQKNTSRNSRLDSKERSTLRPPTNTEYNESERSLRNRRVRKSLNPRSSRHVDTDQRSENFPISEGKSPRSLRSFKDQNSRHENQTESTSRNSRITEDNKSEKSQGRRSNRKRSVSESSTISEEDERSDKLPIPNEKSQRNDRSRGNRTISRSSLNADAAERSVNLPNSEGKSQRSLRSGGEDRSFEDQNSVHANRTKSTSQSSRITEDNKSEKSQGRRRNRKRSVSESSAISEEDERSDKLPISNEKSQINDRSREKRSISRSSLNADAAEKSVNLQNSEGKSQKSLRSDGENRSMKDEYSRRKNETESITRTLRGTEDHKSVKNHDRSRKRSISQSSAISETDKGPENLHISEKKSEKSHQSVKSKGSSKNTKVNRKSANSSICDDIQIISSENEDNSLKIHKTRYGNEPESTSRTPRNTENNKSLSPPRKSMKKADRAEKSAGDDAARSFENPNNNRNGQFNVNRRKSEKRSISRIAINEIPDNLEEIDQEIQIATSPVNLPLNEPKRSTLESSRKKLDFNEDVSQEEVEHTPVDDAKNGQMQKNIKILQNVTVLRGKRTSSIKNKDEDNENKNISYVPTNVEIDDTQPSTSGYNQNVDQQDEEIEKTKGKGSKNNKKAKNVKKPKKTPKPRKNKEVTSVRDNAAEESQPKIGVRASTRERKPRQFIWLQKAIGLNPADEEDFEPQKKVTKRQKPQSKTKTDTKSTKKMGRPKKMKVEAAISSTSHFDDSPNVGVRVVNFGDLKCDMEKLNLSACQRTWTSFADEVEKHKSLNESNRVIDASKILNNSVKHGILKIGPNKMKQAVNEQYTVIYYLLEGTISLKLGHKQIESQDVPKVFTIPKGIPYVMQNEEEKTATLNYIIDHVKS